MRCVALAALGALLGGCDLLFSIQRIDDAVADAHGPVIDAPCLGTGMLSGVCVSSAPATLTVSSAIDTSSDARCTIVTPAIGPALCVIEAHPGVRAAVRST